LYTVNESVTLVLLARIVDGDTVTAYTLIEPVVVEEELDDVPPLAVAFPEKA